MIVNEDRATCSALQQVARSVTSSGSIDFTEVNGRRARLTHISDLFLENVYDGPYSADGDAAADGRPPMLLVPSHTTRPLKPMDTNITFIRLSLPLYFFFQQNFSFRREIGTFRPYGQGRSRAIGVISSIFF